MREPRPDLANVVRDLSLPRYIGAKVIPTSTVMQKAGNLYYADSTKVEEQTVQTGRTLGSEINSVVQGEDKVSYTTEEHSLRVKIDDTSLVTQYGGDLERAKLMAARKAAKSIASSLELNIANTVMGATENSKIDDTSSAIQESVAQAIDNIQDGDGMIVMAMGRDTRATLLNDSDFQNYVGLSNSGIQLTQLITNQFIADAFGVDEVFVGERDFWGAGNANGYGDEIAVFRKPIDLTDEVTMNVVPATIVSYLSPEGDFDTPYQVYEFVSEEMVAHVIDGMSFYEVKALNENLISVIENVGA